jgi:hypothetical protein
MAAQGLESSPGDGVPQADVALATGRGEAPAVGWVGQRDYASLMRLIVRRDKLEVGRIANPYAAVNCRVDNSALIWTKSNRDNFTPKSEGGMALAVRGFPDKDDALVVYGVEPPAIVRKADSDQN